MRFARTYVIALLSLPLVFFALSLEGPAFSQQTTSSNPETLALLQKSLAALVGNTAITDVMLSGTARRIAGSDDEAGNVTFKGLSSGPARLDFSYPSGLRSEIRTVVNAGSAGAWSGPDGTLHPISLHNLMNKARIFPAFTIASFTAGQNFIVTYVGQETKDGHSVYHLSASRQFPDSEGSARTLAEHLTQTDIFLDISTLLPIAFDFSAHPDNDGALDIPAELLFSDYRTVSGIKIPFRVQKFLNNGLVLDLNFQNALVNSGLSGSSFNIQ
jgi:hypothetical protein